ncbi:peptidylprolyl isomerase [Sphingomonas psychrotolerans]|uniref:peptidylprolyl isomerase n=1 Tax=Sphingomonas psychrotolerans TaxID=1327635 RepID=A0ABU3N1L8_9SPHN|nr:peptidylprolyl isomerase [Sphingomonas psychrotolerans]MDT8758373.1 peptidylprolyl isomerase [Sphingomonas psychrotolerans]
MRILLAVLVALLFPLAAAAQGKPIPGTVRVRIETSEGAIVLALDARRAPKTTANFLAYVDDGRLDGTGFYRASRRSGNPKLGFVQGGIASDARRVLPSPPLEPTNVTGIRHADGTVSMAHGASIDGATGNFSIMVGDNPSLDARGTGRNGYSAFGRVVAGMDVVRKILAKPTGGGRGPMRGQMIQPAPVQIVRAVRLDGTPRPTGRVKPWLIGPTRWIRPN